MAPTTQGKPKAKGAKPKKELSSGILKLAKLTHKKAVYKLSGKKVVSKKPAKPLTIEKTIGGEKNGGKRIVLVRKRRNYYPTQDK